MRIHLVVEAIGGELTEKGEVGGSCDSYDGCTRVWTKKSGERISKIIWGVKQRGKHFGKKSGLADIRKPDDAAQPSLSIFKLWRLGVLRAIPLVRLSKFYLSPLLLHSDSHENIRYRYFLGPIS